MRSLLIIALTVLFFGCNTKQEETTTKGNLHIFIPESIAPFMIKEVNAFLGLYNQNGAKITYTLVTSTIAAQHFIQDTTRIAFLTQPLTQTEMERVRLISPDLDEIIIAYDGIAVVVHQKSSVNQMTTTEVKEILTGKISKWNEITGAKSEKGAIKIYCQDSSDVATYLTQRLVKQTGITAKFTRTGSDLQTLRFVEKNRLALGFVALSWIDSAKSTAKVLNLGRTNEDSDTSFAIPAEVIGRFYSPDPSYLFLNYYPLKRTIYMYTRGQINLAAGFGTYVATAEGQKILLNGKILPGTQKIKIKSNQPF
jgi:phosphate transport system substrate-binding protein